ncbi:MAG: class I SAM-dependent methyltransferase, partial [Firmicutes bacterium]|nr:class I SAM-dependent methyltransferase [Bacillota bacterium]
MSENLITKTTVWAMEIVSRYVTAGDTVIDGTMGNGHDTLALAKLVGPEGRVIAFDVQPLALENTRALLESEREEIGGTDVRLILDSNANLRKYVDGGHGREPEAVAAVLFNLGYLPGGDKSVTTTKEETLKAISEAVDLVKPGGLVCAVLYSG